MEAYRTFDPFCRTGWPSPDGLYAPGDQRHYLFESHRLLLAHATPRVSPLGNGSLLLPTISTRWHVANDSRQAPPEGPFESGTQAYAQRRGHRQPVGQDRRKRGDRGYDAGKKISGRKRHILVDTFGLILTVVVHGADVQDRVGAMSVIARIARRFSRLKVIWADGGYGGQFLDWAKHTHGRVVEIVKRNHMSKFTIVPKRWIVERTFAWLGKYRRLSKDYETLTHSSEAMIYVAMINLMIHRLCPG